MKLVELVSRIKYEELMTYKQAAGLIEGYGFVVSGVHSVGSTTDMNYRDSYLICKEKPTSRKEFLIKIK